MSTFDLSVTEHLDAPPGDCFDGFLALYGRDGADFILESELDLRVGGRWSVRFDPAPNPPFREERTITGLERPGLLAYDATICDDDGTERFTTAVTITCRSVGAGTDVTLRQTGFADASTRDEFEANWPGVLTEVGRRLGD